MSNKNKAAAEAEQQGQEHIRAVATACEDAGETRASSALQQGIDLGIPWQELLRAFVKLALPAFIEWVSKWVANDPATHKIP